VKGSKIEGSAAITIGKAWLTGKNGKEVMVEENMGFQES